MDIGRWEQPVTIETGELGVYRTISSTAEAARVLLEGWPHKNGIALTKAKSACLSVLEGLRPRNSHGRRS